MDKFNTFSIYLTASFILFTLVMLFASQISLDDVRSFYLAHISEFAVALFVLVVIGFSIKEKRN